MFYRDAYLNDTSLTSFITEIIMLKLLPYRTAAMVVCLAPVFTEASTSVEVENKTRHDIRLFVSGKLYVGQSVFTTPCIPSKLGTLPSSHTKTFQIDHCTQNAQEAVLAYDAPNNIFGGVNWEYPIKFGVYNQCTITTQCHPQSRKIICRDVATCHTLDELN